MNVAFLGLGLMGTRMAVNLLSPAPGLLVHNRTRSKADELIAAGARWAETPSELAAEAEVVFTMLSDPDAVRATAFGDDGFLQALPTGALWIDCSTVDPGTSRSLAEECAKGGIRFLDAPVAGSTPLARDGELTFLVGGNAEDIEEVRHLLEAMGKNILHVGPVGMGSSLKLVVNLFLGEQMAAFCEAARFGRDLGVPYEMLLDTILTSRIAPGFITAKKDNFTHRGYPPEFPLELMRKDIQLAVDTAYRSASPLPIGSMCGQLYGFAQNRRLGRQDFSALHGWFESI